MLKKELFITLFVLLQTIGLMAQESRFKEGETLNIWASSGLNMRDKPDAKATKTTTIPYGAKVIVQPNIGLKIPFEVEEFKGFIVKGYWLLVKYGNTEGFVFDGFLSRLPSPKKGTIEQYLTNEVGKVGGKYGVLVWNKKGNGHDVRKPLSNEKIKPDEIQQFNQNYKHGFTYSFRTGEAMIYELYSSEITLYEGYIFIKSFFFDEELDFFKYDKEEKAIFSTQKVSSMGCSFSVKKEKKKIQIQGFCGC